jgi:hypothetical protein
MEWSADDISIDIVDHDTDHPIACVLIATPMGRLTLMGVPEWTGDRMLVRGVHIQSDGRLGPNRLGPAGVRRLAILVMESLHVRELVVVGEIRTTGAGPGHRPRPLRFTRTLPS